MIAQLTPPHTSSVKHADTALGRSGRRAGRWLPASADHVDPVDGHREPAAALLLHLQANAVALQGRHDPLASRPPAPQMLP
jgi:hypothetical protein